MIVQTMTPDEIFKEIIEDGLDVMRMFNVKAHYMAKQMVRTKNFRWTETIHLKSRRQNNWSMAIDLSAHSKLCAFFMKVEDKSGLTAYSWFLLNELPVVIRFNPHFFKRYRERLQLTEVNPHQIIKRFYKQNSVFIPAFSDQDEKGVMLSAFRMKEGMGLGRTWANTPIVEVKTFLPHQMLNKSQAELADQLLNDESYMTGLEFTSGTSLK